MTWTETVSYPPAGAAHGESGGLLGEVVSPFASGEYARDRGFSGGYRVDESPGSAGENGVPLTAEQMLFAEWETGESAVTPFSHGAAASDREIMLGELISELTTSELGEALGELAQEWSGVHAEHASLGGMEVLSGSLREAAMIVGRRSDELSVQTEQYLEAMAELAGERAATTMTEAEVATLLEQMESVPVPAGATPVQEQFFKAIGRAVGRAVRGVVRLAGKGLAFVGKLATAPLRFIFSRLGKLVRPLLRRVLTWAISRLPAPLQPLATQLRRRLFGAEVAGAGEFEILEAMGEWNSHEVGGSWVHEDELAAELAGEATWRGQLPAVAEAGSLEAEFNSLVARYLTSEHEAEFEQYEAEFEATTSEYENAAGAHELDAARVRLITELAALRDGESAAPVIERFLPVVLPVLRIGVRLIGRRRVVNFLAGLLGKLIQPLVGPQLAQPLSQAVVDAGLRIFTLEMTETDRQLAGPAAVASVVEDTVRRLAELGNEVFEDNNRLHTEAIVAFNEAVAQSVPSSLLRGDLTDRETPGNDNATWLLRPRVYWYRKYARVFDVVLTPQMADAITTFGAIRVSAQLRADGVRLPVRTRVHLYETLPGTYLSRIAALERQVPGMSPDGWRRFHPLSITAAGVLLGEPGLGRDVDARYTNSRNLVAAGQRVFYLEVPGRSGTTGFGTASQAFVTLDARPARNAVRLFIYLSEADAQAIASRARQNNTTAFVIALRAAFVAAVRSLRQSPRSRVTILKEVVGENEAGGGIASAIGGKIIDAVVQRLIDAAVRLATDYVRAKGDEFVRAADSRANGVTVIVTLPAQGLSTIMRGGIIGSVASIGLLRTMLGSISAARPGLMTVAGFRRA